MYRQIAERGIRRYLVQLRLCESCTFYAMDQGSKSVCLLSAHKDSDITAYLTIGSRDKNSDNGLLLRHGRPRIHISMVSHWGYYLLSGHCTSTKVSKRLWSGYNSEARLPSAVQLDKAATWQYIHYIGFVCLRQINYFLPFVLQAPTSYAQTHLSRPLGRAGIGSWNPEWSCRLGGSQVTSYNNPCSMWTHSLLKNCPEIDH